MSLFFRFSYTLESLAIYYNTGKIGLSEDGNIERIKILAALKCFNFIEFYRLISVETHI